MKKSRGQIEDPLHLAVRKRALRDLVGLINAGHDIEALDKDGRTPLFYSAFHGHVAVINELLRNGAQSHARDDEEKTPLHFAAQEFQLEAVAALVQGGAKIDAQDKDGNTPLSDAVFYARGRGDMIRLLLRLGADRNLKNSHGVSPFELAESIPNYDVVKFFKK